MLNNTTELVNKISDIIALLNVYLEEVKLIEQARVALENSQSVNTNRETRIAEREITLNQREKDQLAQKLYIEEQNKNAQIVLNKIALEKKNLENLADEKREIEKGRLQLELDRKALEGLQREKEDFQLKWENFEKEKQLFSQEKLAIADHTKLLAIREQNIKAKEERLNTIERMTAV